MDNPTPALALNRRRLLSGAAATGLAVPALAACGSEDAPAGAADTGDGAGSTTEPPATGGGEGALVAAADVPVGGGVVLKDDGVVVTQPTEGEFKAFSAVCTHQGCVVASVADGAIVCNCHGSQFSVVDGSVLSPPAGAPLAEQPVKVQGDQVVSA